VQLPEVAARLRIRTSTATAAATADGRPTNSAMHAIMLMRTGDAMLTIAPPRYTRAIVRTLLLLATVRHDAPTISAIDDQTPAERSRTRGMLQSGGTARGVDMRPRAPPIPLLPRTGTTIDTVSQGTTGMALRRVSTATTTRAIPSHEITGRLIRPLRR
jgi:hypothetical protein